jgi:hypothetical protein
MCIITNYINIFDKQTKNNYMKKMLFAAALVASVCIIGCKNNDSGNPTEVLIQFFDAMSKQDKVKIKELTTAESSSMISLMEIGMDKSGKDMEKFDKSKMEFGTAVINGDNAKVPVKEKGKGETTNFSMKKEAGKWKVAFDKASMMEMATGKMNDKGIDISDSLTDAVDKLKSMNLDSMTDEIKKGMKDINTDEMKKEMDKAMEEIKKK